MCGELSAVSNSRSLASGSSPRVRGTRTSARLTSSRPTVHPRVCGELTGRPHDRAHRRRFIPACAGNSPARRSRRPPPTVHPRVCGELGGQQVQGGRPHGSSPRVRGTPRRPPSGRRLRRFIPACAGNSAHPPPPTFTSTVHPRVCGELRCATSRTCSPRGSSPRVRGTQAAPKSSAVRRRFIPACAGNSSSSAGIRCSITVHPRVCGELVSYQPVGLRSMRFIPACAGNSTQPRTRPGREPVHPRVCGELASDTAGDYSVTRFIPACAGNSRTSAWRALAVTVHPRVCGELALLIPDHGRIHGSSPRVRGTPFGVLNEGIRQRFIPACAGNSHDWPRIPPFAAVHPRVCGELDGLSGWQQGERRFIPACAGNSSARRPLLLGLVGSSPRVRGTPGSGPRVSTQDRFIPACAGNSSPRPTRRQSPAVHPRVCGELRRPPRPTRTRFGSSPRVRGTRASGSSNDSLRRFIPACAGNSSAGGTPRRSAPVHPRVCGELETPRLPCLAQYGSSPRVRGTRRRGRERWRLTTGSSPRVRGTLGRQVERRSARRFIPACAGNSQL